MPLATTYCPVDCDCHTSPYTPCSEPGGCGSTGCAPRPAGACPACRKRDPEHGLVCEPCRRWIPVALDSIRELAERLTDQLIPAEDSSRQEVLTCTTCGETAPTPHHDANPQFDDPNDNRRHEGWTPRLLIRHAGGPAPSLPTDTIITTGGTTEANTPIDLHIHDLLADVVRDGARPIDATGDNWITVIVGSKPRKMWTDNGWKREGQQQHLPAGDQIGVISIAQTLDQEVRAWIDHGAPGGQHRPTPTINNLVDWLTKRLNWACDNYPAIDTLTDALTELRGQAMSALGDFDPQAELCDGVDCPRCNLRMLYRRQDGTGDVECQNPDCLRVLTAADYHEHVKNAAKDARTRH